MGQIVFNGTNQERRLAENPWEMARLTGFEPVTIWFEAKYAFQHNFFLKQGLTHNPCPINISSTYKNNSQ